MNRLEIPPNKSIKEKSHQWPWQRRTTRLPKTIKEGQPWPKISIITPSFNQGTFIEETIRSVLLQGYPNLEYIIIDGGSNDQTVDIIHHYEKHLTYWVSEKDNGQAHAVNKGLDRASGEIIGWINSDDMYCRGAFRCVAEAFLQSPNAVLVHGNRILLDARTNVSGWAILPEFDPNITGFNVCSETAFWRSSLISSERLREDLHFAMDLEFFCRLYQLGQFVKLNTFLGYFRCYAENKSSTIPHIGRVEAEREWKSRFGEENEGWNRRSNVNRFTQLLEMIRHPKLVLLPYIYRRFILKKRGL